VRLLRFAVLAATVAACVPTQNALAPNADYAAYRKYKLADAYGARLAAASAYLAAHPLGEFRGEVAAWFGPAELRFFESAGHTIGGARAYLELLPQGPHAEEERRLVAAWEKEQIEGPAREKKALEDARKKADAARKALGETIEAWTQKAVKLSAYRVDRATLEKNDGQFAEPFFHDPPEAQCDPDGCSKRYTFGYPVPEANPPLDRKVGLEVRMETAAGLVVAISMVLPRYGFVYWLEGAEVRAVEKTDPAVQGEALMRAKNRIESIVRKHVGEDCTTDEADEARTLTCGKVRVVVKKGPAGEDLVRILAL